MVSQSQEPSRNLSHLEILVLSKKKKFSCVQSLKMIILFENLATLGHKTWLDESFAMIVYCWNL